MGWSSQQQSHLKIQSNTPKGNNSDLQSGAVLNAKMASSAQEVASRCGNEDGSSFFQRKGAATLRRKMSGSARTRRRATEAGEDRNSTRGWAPVPRECERGLRVQRTQ